LQRTCRIGSYEPNLLELHDMHGNVAEWCEDAEKVADGALRRVNRGGGWYFDSGLCRAANRGTGAPSHRNSILGLRLARVPSVPAGK
jgi:sulfatase modifying factor 1